MIKQYYLQGLECAACAAKIEIAAQNHESITSATLNFINSTLTVEFPGTRDKDALALISKLVHKYEPDITVTEKDAKKAENHSHDYPNDKRHIVRLIIGAALFVLAIVINYFFTLNGYVKLTLFLCAYLTLGADVIWSAVKNILKGQIFDENFLMSLATIVACATGNYSEAAAVMLFYQIGELFQQAAVRRSKKSIADLMDIRPDFAWLQKDGEIMKVSPAQVKPHDIIMVKPGEKIPLDGTVIDGRSSLDTKALTGESLPREVCVSDTVLSGCINQSGVLIVEVAKSFEQSTVAQIIDLVQNSGSKKARTENFITKFSKYYTPVVVMLAALIAIVPPIFDGQWAQWVNRGLIFLVISCPCALVISVPLGFFGGIGSASKNGILVKGGNYLDALNKLEIVVFDKTGTLTKGVFKVNEIIPADNFTAERLLDITAHAEVFSNHPIAKSVLNAHEGNIDKEKLSDYTEISGHGISVLINGARVLAGNERLMLLENIPFSRCGKTGTKIYTAVDGVFAGCIVISDEIKSDSRNAIDQLRGRGVRKTVMLTGDEPNIAKTIAGELGLDEFHAGLLPVQKVEMVEALCAQKSQKGTLAFVGDGINDAPVLARADIGVAMGALGSDAAIEAADIVIMTDELGKLALAIDIAKFTRRIVMQNIILALGIKAVFLLLGALGMANMWEAVFADVGVSVLAVLNAMRVLNFRKK